MYNIFCGILSNIYILLLLCSVSISEIVDKGGGRLVEPPGRSSLWRLNASLFPVNINDHRTNCGGFEKHWLDNKGKCGICGDPIDSPKHHENGGKFDSGYISGKYLQSEIINVTVESISNLYGYFEFRICKYSKNKIITKDCLDDNVLRIGDTEYTRYKVLHDGYHVIPLQLPETLHCEKCLLQIKYHTGYLWGCIEDQCCYGCGAMQEEFYSCADISVQQDSALKYRPNSKNKEERSSLYMRWWCIFQCNGDECHSDVCSRYFHLRKKRQTADTCKGTGMWEGNVAIDDWCRTNCATYCPPFYCSCDDSTKSTTTVTTTPGMLFIYVTPSEFTATFGDIFLQIQCIVTGIPEPSNWYWTKTSLDGRSSITLNKDINSPDYTVDQSPTNPQLTILGITKDDEADYICHADNGGGTRSSARSRLIVQGGLLDVKVAPAEQTAAINDVSVQLECQVTGLPEATSWHWVKTPLNGGPQITIERGTDTNEFTVADSPTNPKLTIKALTKEDEADYECYAINVAGIISSNTKSRLFVKDNNPTVVKVLAGAGCEYCNSRNNVTCANWYCSEEYAASLDYTGTLMDKVMKLADDFCSICTGNDTSCQELFCMPNRRIISFAIQARCNLCKSTNINCPNDPECEPFSNSLQSSEILQPKKLAVYTCRGFGVYASASMDQWCQTVCPLGVCPATHCECGNFEVETTTQSLVSSTIPMTTAEIVISGADLYSANTANRIMCSICSQNTSNAFCSSKYCGLYYSNLEEPSNSGDRVLSFSSSIFCALGTNERNNNMRNMFCGGTDAAIVPELKIALCTVCQTTGIGNQCNSYCL